MYEPDPANSALQAERRGQTCPESQRTIFSFGFVLLPATNRLTSSFSLIAFGMIPDSKRITSSALPSRNLISSSSATTGDALQDSLLFRSEMREVLLERHVRLDAVRVFDERVETEQRQDPCLASDGRRKPADLRASRPGRGCTWSRSRSIRR